MRYALALVCACVLVLTPFALADNGQPTPTPVPESIPTTPAPPCTPAKRVYARKHWRREHPARGLHVCKISRRRFRPILTEFRTYRAYRQIARVPGLHEGDPYLRWLVIPAWVVAAETRGYYGEGRWHASNPSGACGPYQLLGHTSCEVSDNADKLRMHRVAAGLPRGSWEVGY